LLAAILFGVAGLLIVVRPAVSAEVITMFMAMFFLIGGLFQRSARWPATGLWVLGLFIGIDLIVYGIAWIALAFGLRGS
jgi:uncharacterized membrane protein HdeD (DUF308 family)